LSAVTVSLSPSRRAWQRFRRNRLGFVQPGAVLHTGLFSASFAEADLSNDKPLVCTTTATDSALVLPDSEKRA
jgi:ABC-type microcin C transport system permease subunit YejE